MEKRAERVPGVTPCDWCGGLSVIVTEHGSACRAHAKDLMGRFHSKSASDREAEGGVALGMIAEDQRR